MSQRIQYAKQSPELVSKLFELSQLSLKGSIERSLIDLVNLRASLLNGCAFCVDMHAKEAKIHGERELRIIHVPIWRESTLFTDRERAALEWTEAVTKLSAHGVSDEIFDLVSAHLSEKEISDLTFAIGIINAWNRLAIPFRAVPGSSDVAFGLIKSGLA